MKLRYRIKEWIFKKFWPDEWRQTRTIPIEEKYIIYEMTFDVVEMKREKIISPVEVSHLKPADYDFLKYRITQELIQSILDEIKKDIMKENCTLPFDRGGGYRITLWYPTLRRRN